MLLIFVDRKMLLILSEEERNVASPSSRDIGFEGVLCSRGVRFSYHQIMMMMMMIT